VETLFAFQGLIFGSVEANYFTRRSRKLIQQFVDRRGGGVLFLGGRASLADGGYDKPPFADLLPVHLPPNRKNTFHASRPRLKLTAAGRESLITRIDENPDTNVTRWKKLPYLMNYQEAGVAKPGALTLANMLVGGHPLPLLVTQKYGRGRTAVSQPAAIGAGRCCNAGRHESRTFLASDAALAGERHPTRLVGSTAKPVLFDDGRSHLRAEVRDTTYLPTSDAQVDARILGPDGAAQSVELHPDPLEQGAYSPTGMRGGPVPMWSKSPRTAASRNWAATW